MLDEQLRLIYKLSNIGFISCDRQGEIVKFNQVACLIFKRNLEGLNVADIIPKHMVARHPGLMETFVKGDDDAKPMQSRTHIKAHDADGAEICLRIGLIKSENVEGELELIAVIEDVSRLVKAEEKLSAAKSKRKLLKSVLLAQKSVSRYFQIAGLLVSGGFVWFAVTTQINFKHTAEGSEFGFSPREPSQIEKLLQNIPTIGAALGGAGVYLAGKNKEKSVIKHVGKGDDEDDEDD